MKFMVPIQPAFSDTGELAKQALGDGEFPWYDASKGEFKFHPEPVEDPNGDWWLRQLQAFMDWLTGWDLPGGLSMPTGWIEILIWTVMFCLLAALLVVLMIALIDAIGGSDRSAKNTISNAADFTVGDEILESDLPYSVVWQKAQEYKSIGKNHEAVSLAWLAIIKRFLVHHDVQNQKSLTPRQWARIVDQTLPESHLHRLIGFYELVIFGNRMPPAFSLDRWWTSASHTYGSIKDEE